MKRTTPLWLLNKYKAVLLNKLAPLKKTEIDGLVFYYLRSESPPQDPKIFSERSQEFHKRIDRLSGETAIDVGANIGSYTLRLARKFKTVVAFEPSPAHNNVLKLNLRSNKLPNVLVEEMALSDVTGVMPFYIRLGGASSLDSSHYDLKYDKVNPVTVSRLDDLGDKLGRVDFIKIDAENSELPILRGAQETLAVFRPLLAVEVHRSRVRSDGACACETCAFLRMSQYEIEVTGEIVSAEPVHWVWATPEL